ncbi:transcription initiation factor TFIID subunit 8-like [Tasmannia lanceolata]|uniref:transcription initiation factor TFIID subunit 8-like n=1 Tax=Tasmannia lanceolata TaxID=3420 RepID=UPI0040632970
METSKKNRRRKASSSSSSTCTSSASLPSAISKISVAQICNSIGFNGAQQSALETLTNIATRYLQTLAKSASSSANSTGRTHCNLFDVIRAIEDLNSIQGFHGASDIKKPLIDSSILREIMSFVRSIDEIPFAHPIPRKSSSNQIRVSKTFFELGQDPPFSHIPAWLPVFPDPSSYKDSGGGIRVRVIEEKEEEERDVGNCRNDGESRDLPVERGKVRLRLGLGFRQKCVEYGVYRGKERVFWRGGDEEER